MTEDIPAVAAQIEQEVNQATPHLLRLPDSLAGYSAGPGHWSKKMLLGHLIDSAANNHQRFVRTTQESQLAFPAYAQEFWVNTQHYQEAKWTDLIELWRYYNLHLAFIIPRIPESALAHEITVGADAPVTLAWLISDYLRHLRHHLEDLLMPASKTELLERIEQSRLELAEALNRLSEADLLIPVSDGGWTIKDHLVHLAAWELGIAALLQHRPRWAAMGLNEADLQNSVMDDWNEIIYRQNRERSLPEVMTYLHEAQQQMLTALDGLTEEELFKPYAYFEGGEADDDTRPIINWIIGNTYEHYDEHRGWLEALS